MVQKSGRNYSLRTIKILWGRAAGRCAVPTCRIELFAEATDYDPVVLIGDIAHIEASSESGPRGNRNKATKDRDEYDNLILLCKNCHARLDGQKNTNSVEYIRQLRNDHEAWVRNSLPERGKSTTGWATILLQGIYPFDLETTIVALLPDFPSGEPLTIKIDPEQENWSSIQIRLRIQINSLLKTQDPFDFRTAIFPLAPVSACLALGYYLTNRPHTRLFQYHRDNHSWGWPDNSPLLSELTVSGLPDQIIRSQDEIAIAFDLSAAITDDVIQEANSQFLGKVHVAIPSPNTGWLQHQDQLKELAKITRWVFEKCVQNYPNVTKWHIFYAGPAPGAVMVGQQINPTMCPPVQLYEYQHKRTPAYLPSIILSEDSNDQ